jgi:hypothetical protein
LATLGDLRTYTLDMLADASDGKSDRVAQRVINDALAKVFSAHPWSRFRALTHIPLDQAVARTSLSIALDSNNLTCGSSEVFLQKFVDQRWMVTITGDDDLFFTLSHLDNERSARLTDPQKWITTSASAVAGVFKRTVYSLPTGCLAVRDVELNASRYQLVRMRPDRLDREKFENPTETGSPQYYCVRQGEIEVWPPLGTTTTREALLVSYEREPAVFKVTDPNGLKVDWEERHDDLLRLAIDLEVATRYGGVSRLDPAVAMARYRDRLQTLKGDDEGIVVTTTSMSLGMGSLTDPEEFVFRRSPTAADS